MARTLRSKLTYANVMATIAVFIALGGSSYAAITITSKNVPKNALTGADIKNLTGKDVRNNSLTGADVRNLGSADVANGGLLAEDFAPGQLPRGEQFNGAAAGGDLSGTYPNPDIAPGAVTASKLANGSVVATKLGKVVVRTVVQAVADGSGNSANAVCNAGETAVGGGASLDSFASDVPLISSRPANADSFFELPANGNSYNAWRASAINPSGGTGGTVSVRAHVLCLQP